LSAHRTLTPQFLEIFMKQASLKPVDLVAEWLIKFRRSGGKWLEELVSIFEGQLKTRAIQLLQKLSRARTRAEQLAKEAAEALLRLASDDQRRLILQFAQI